MELTLFLYAISGDLVALMSSIGSIVLLVLGLTTFYSRPTPRWIILGVAAVCFFFAAARVWTTEHRTAEASKAQLASLTKPNISGEFTTEIAAPTGEKKEDSLVTLGMHIRNTGAPTALEKFALVITRNGTTLQTQALPPTNVTLVAGSSPTGPRVSFRIEDNLFQKAAHESVPMNGAIDVWFQAAVLGVTNDKVLSTGTTVLLFFDDVATGKKSSITYIATNERVYPPDMHKLMQETH